MFDYVIAKIFLAPIMNKIMVKFGNDYRKKYGDNIPSEIEKDLERIGQRLGMGYLIAGLSFLLSLMLLTMGVFDSLFGLAGLAIGLLLVSGAKNDLKHLHEDYL